MRPREPLNESFDVIFASFPQPASFDAGGGQAPAAALFAASSLR